MIKRFRALRPKEVSLLIGGVLLILTLHAIGWRFMGGFPLDLGTSLNGPSPRYGRFLALWIFFGSLAAVCVAAGVTGLLERSSLRARWVAAWRRSSERKWLAYGTVFGLLIPMAIRTFVLCGAPLTDDEAAYRLMAEILSTGRLYIDSPALKLFFDNRFLINDGKLYAAYFLGWPALMVPGVWLEATGSMNAVYSALTVPAVFLVARRLVGGAWARAAVLLYLLSPMLMVGAATETSHTSCTMALAWLTWFCLRSRDPAAPWWSHAGTALLFSVAFFIRPSSALGVGTPLLAWWGLGLRGRERPHRRMAILSSAAPAIVMATLFFSVNHIQNGSIFTVSYERALAYAEENLNRFTVIGPDLPADPVERLEHRTAVAGAALFRLNVDLFGWPFSLLFALLAWRGKLRATLWAAVATYFALHHFLLPDVGIDSFAPMHYFELAWPLLLLTVAGLDVVTGAGARLEGLHPLPAAAVPPPSAGLRTFPAAFAASLAVVTLAGFLPVRLGALHRIAENVALPQRAFRDAGLQNAVVFSSDPFVYYCRSAPSRGWVFARPNNDAALENDPLWVNHLSVEKDRLLMRHFPGRDGYVMLWDNRCRVHFLPLAELAPGAVPPARVPGLDEVGESPGAGSHQ